MPPRKRPVSQIDAKTHAAKVAAADAQIAEGHPPPEFIKLAAETTNLAASAMFKHEAAWHKVIHDLDGAAHYLRRTLAEARILRAISSEKIAYGINDAQPVTHIDSSMPLLFYTLDIEAFYEYSWVPDYSGICACCDQMKASWDNVPKHYGRNSDPRWRVIGTTHFVCRFCFERIRGGARLAIVNASP